MLEESVIEVSSRRPTVVEIQNVVTKHYGVPRTEFLSNRRTRAVVRPRQIAMFLAKKLTTRSLPEIGRFFGGRDHTTVLHAVRKIEAEITENPELATEILELQKRIDEIAVVGAVDVVEKADLARLDKIADKIARMISIRLGKPDPKPTAKERKAAPITVPVLDRNENVDRLVQAARRLASDRYSPVEKHAIEQVISAVRAFG